MPTVFTALPVSRGDAFLLRTDTASYLFDGGIQQAQAAQQLVGLGVSHLTATICSHNDADHANGIIGVLRSAIHVDEVWIPGTWAQFLNSVGAIHTFENPWSSSLANEILSRFADAEGFDEVVHEVTLNREDPAEAEVVDAMQSIVGVLQSLAPRLPSHLMLALAVQGLAVPQVHTVSSALQAGQRIIDIAQLAMNRNCRLRVFEFQDSLINENVHGANFISVNSREVKKLRGAGILLDLLCLTMVNRQSLVFHYIDGVDSPILFCADSDFSFLHRMPFHAPQFTLATSPHHGSHDNRRVYAEVQCKDITWVRSDASATGRRPCSAYLRQTTRFCTICRNSMRPKQQVDFTWNKGKWRVASSVHACSCR